jgi:membrane-bound metal-dependent hydrolase YbcI (DUF457 family)
VTGPEHCIFGALVSHLGFHQRWGARLTGVIVVASILPDVDSLTIIGGRLAFYRYHRTLTHSLAGVVAASVVLAALARMLPRLARWAAPRFSEGGRAGRALRYLADGPRNPLRNFPLLFGVGLLAMVLHLGIDALYPWEIPALWPLSAAEVRYSLVDWGDRLVLTVMLAGMMGLGIWRQRARQVAVVALSALGVYLLGRLLLIGPLDIAA